MQLQIPLITIKRKDDFMNNNQMNFDPMTGQPITRIPNTNNIPNNVIQSNNTIESNNISNSNQINPNLNQNTQSMQNTIVNQMQSIPTVDQSKQAFIDNTQSMTSEKKNEKKEGINYTFIIILFVIILASIFFLFPYIFKNL